MGPLKRRVYVCALQCATNDYSYSVGVSKTSARRLRANEHPARLAGRSVLAQVGGQGLAYINRQGHPLVKPSLAANKDLSGSPVDVLELESDHFPGAKTKADKQKKDSVVAAAHRRAAVAGLEHTFDLLRR